MTDHPFAMNLILWLSIRSIDCEMVDENDPFRSQQQENVQYIAEMN